MPWKIEYAEGVAKSLLAIDRHQARRIKKYLDERIATADDPRALGHGLSSNLAGLWRYRVGDYRIIAEIQDRNFVVLALRIGHRKEVYDN